ncbi:MAG: Shikimate dehydrogenase (NADP(+)) [Chlamydiae bacterium]|nr:Shikimate dehydrogenase (NADP(+)) [Chlamydiota bacterium]
MEFRLDLYKITIEELKQLKQLVKTPVLFTFKNMDIEPFLELKPDWVDLELEAFDRLFPLIKSAKVIVSKHRVSLEDLTQVIAQLQTKDADLFKCVLNEVTPLQALQFVHEKKDPRLILLSVGIGGQLTRILSSKMHNPIHYVSVESFPKTAPGQLTIDELNHYHLSDQKNLFGLIGNPVDSSRGHIFHNHIYKTLGMDACYVKIQLEEKELKSFFEQLRLSDFKGLSVTMPFKEKVIEFLDEVEKDALEMGAVNTITIRNHRLIGSNTDGLGDMDLKAKSVFVLGAGGVARAIVHQLKKQGADVTIFNRSVEKAKKFGVPVFPLEQFKEHLQKCDVLINATSVGMHGEAFELSEKDLSHCQIVIDAVQGATPLLSVARQAGCQVISGKQLFIEQAMRQYQTWFL